MVKPCNEKPEERSDSKFKGVRKRKWGKYVSEIRLPNSRQRIWLGSYDSAEKAARAFDAAMFCLRGRNAKFNFPDNPPDIAGGRSMTPSQIQVAAAQFANTGRPHEVDSGQPESSSMVPYTLTESPSPSISEGTVQTDSDVTTHNGSLTDLFTPVGSSNNNNNYAFDYGIFPGFDDFSGDFYVPEMPNVNYGEENVEGFVVDESFLWNF